jgi:ribonuclease PH
MGTTRSDGRESNALRPLQAELDFIPYPEGSVLFSMGGTRVLCNASIEMGVPGWMQLKGRPGGWVTAEYSMLPRATHSRSQRETIRPRARTQEIRRLIGRSLRSAFKLNNLPEITCILDCDVLQANGGTRTASISGGYLAVAIALHRYLNEHSANTDIFSPAVAAVSVGLVDGRSVVDLDYEEDSSAEFDLNVVMNTEKSLIEVQGTAEAGVIDKSELMEMLSLAEGAILQILKFQNSTLRNAGVELSGEIWGQ